MKGKKSDRASGLIGRRDLLKGLATIPVLGAIAYGIYRKKRLYNEYKNNILSELNFGSSPVRVSRKVNNNQLIRLGIIGYGIRGRHLLRAAGYAEPEWIDDVKKASGQNRFDTTYEDYMNQEGLNVAVKGVCDIFDIHAGEAIRAGANIYREGVKGKI